MHVEGTVRLCNRFKVTGQICIDRAVIEGNLSFNNSILERSGSMAVSGNNSKIKGSVFFDTTTVTGVVWWMGATIIGSLLCYGSTFKNVGGISFSLEGAEISNNVLLADNSKSIGEVSLAGTTIGGNLQCDGGTFYNPKKIALRAQCADIKGTVFLCNGFRATGIVEFSGATIGGTFDCNNSTFHNPYGFALLAQKIKIQGAALFRNGFSSKGEVRLFAATIGGVLDCSNGTFDNPKGYALMAMGADIGNSVLLNKYVTNNKSTEGFKALGTVSFHGATINGDLNCNGGSFYTSGDLFQSFEREVLFATGVEVKGNVFLARDFKSSGKISFHGAVVGGNFQYCNQHVSNKVSLDLSFAKIRTLVVYPKGWPKQGNLSLLGLVYENIIDYWDTEISCLKWLQLQYPDEIKVSALAEILSSCSPDFQSLNLSLYCYYFNLYLRLCGKLQQALSFQLSFQSYERLAQVLKRSGREKESLTVLIGKQNDCRKYGRLNGWNYFLNRFFGAFIDYGYRPQKALKFSLGLVMVGTMLFGLGYSSTSRKLITPSKITTSALASSNSNKISDDYPVFNPLIYSLDVFVPIINLHQQDFWLPNANRGAEISIILFKCRTGSLLRWYFWFHIISGWILTSLWVASFTGLVRSVE